MCLFWLDRGTTWIVVLWHLIETTVNKNVMNFTFLTGRHPERKISKDWRHKTCHAHWSPLWESPRYIYLVLLYSWRFSRYSASFHWLVHGHMTSNNETVSRQMPWAGNIAKTMISNGRQFTVTREMLTAVARDRWNLSAVFKFCFCFVLLYNKSLNDWSLGEQCILFPSNLNVSRLRLGKHWDSQETKFTVPLGTSH